MGAILTVFAKEFRENLRDRRTLFTALIFGPLFAPLLFSAVLSLMIQRGDAQKDLPLSLAVSHSERAPNLIGQLAAVRRQPSRRWASRMRKRVSPYANVNTKSSF